MLKMTNTTVSYLFVISPLFVNRFSLFLFISYWWVKAQSYGTQKKIIKKFWKHFVFLNIDRKILFILYGFLKFPLLIMIDFHPLGEQKNTQNTCHPIKLHLLMEVGQTRVGGTIYSNSKFTVTYKMIELMSLLHI